MCSTPRPRSRVVRKAGTSNSILSGMSTEARSRFTERANIAQERRYQIAIQARQKKHLLTPSAEVAKNVVDYSPKKLQGGFSYWLFTASLKEIFTLVFINTAKRM